jgi:hypothetical protein
MPGNQQQQREGEPMAFTLHADEDQGDLATCEIDVTREEAYWQAAYRRESYFSAVLDYEDYAPAYCVGYTGFAQYGGTFEDAEKSLVANWVRIKGDSRLPHEQACAAIRAAWNRAASA